MYPHRFRYIIAIMYSSMLTAGFSILGVFAQELPDAFIVDVEPSSFDVNEPVDLTIRAVRADGTVVDNYDGDVFIDIEGVVDPDDFVVPSDGLYTFILQDQGVKLFSKGLELKVPGTFTVRVSEIIDDSINGEQTIIVGTNTAENVEDINLITPTINSIEKTQAIDVLATADNLPNSPYQILINDEIVAQGVTTANGDISTVATGAVEGSNTIQVQITNANNIMIGESNAVAFTYQPVTDGVFQNIQVIPNSQLQQGDKIEVTVTTNDTVTSVVLLLDNGNRYPMDRVAAGTFTKEILLEMAGTVNMSVNLTTAGNQRSYPDVKILDVAQNVTIGNIKYYTEGADKSSITLSWTPIGQAPQYRVVYGTNENALTLSQVVTTTEIQIQNINPEEVYYFQIEPVGTNGENIGTSSDIIEIDLQAMQAAATCKVENISITTEKIGDRYYLTRDAVDNADNYVIYRSEEGTDRANMRKVGETADTQFEYPFNNFAKRNQYAYYIVEAICTDGSAVQIDDVKEVQVGPYDNLFLIIAITLFVYSMFVLYRFSK